MTIPDYQALLAPVLELAAQGEKSVPLVEDEIASKFGLTSEEKEKLLPSGKQRVLNNRIHWAKFYLTKAGLIEVPRRGRFTITTLGRNILAKPPQKIDTEFLMTFPSFQAFYSGQQNDAKDTGQPEIKPSTATPEEAIESAYGEALAGLRADLLERVLQNSPRFFEQLIVDLLVSMGYGGSHRNASEHLGKSGDGGIDGVINEDILGLDRVYVQAKRYSAANLVGRPEIQAFTGSLVGNGATKGVFVTTSRFSKEALAFAARIPQRIILIDGLRLTELMIEYNVGVRSHRTLEFKRLDEDFFSEE